MMPITLTIKITDSLCTWNDGVFELTLGESVMPKVKRVSDVAKEDIDLIIDVGGLACLLMGAVSAKDLVLRANRRRISLVDYLDMVYPKQNTYINEWW